MISCSDDACDMSMTITIRWPEYFHEDLHLGAHLVSKYRPQALQQVSTRDEVHRLWRLVLAGWLAWLVWLDLVGCVLMIWEGYASHAGS